MKHKRTIPVGTTITRLDDGRVHIGTREEDVAHRYYRLDIDNLHFHKETHKERLINTLVDLYYQHTLPPDKEEQVKTLLLNVKEMVESEHIHDWDYIDNGNFIAGDKHLYRFVCVKCGDYRRIEFKSLREGINKLINETTDTQPTKFIPNDDKDLGGEMFKPRSNYDN